MFRKRYATLGATLRIVTIGGMAILMAGVLLWALTLGAAAQAESGPDQRDAIEQAVAWLVQTHQNDDGGYTSFSTGANQAPSDVGGTLDVMLAMGSVGYNLAVPAPGETAAPVDYLAQHVAELEAYAAADGGTAGKAILALVAANQNPRDFEGVDLVLQLTNHLSPTGQFQVSTAFNQSLAILSLSAVNEPVPESAVAWLLAQQAQGDALDGSWDDGFGTGGNADATAMAVMALAASGMPADADPLVRAADFLARTRLESSGWEYGPGFGENANSTALAIQALSALGQDFYTGGDTPSALSALLSWQGESGAFQADFGDGRFDDFFSTVQALPAVAGKPLPIRGRYEAARRAVSCLATLQDPATGGWEQFATFGVNAAGTSRAIQVITAFGDDPTSDRWTAGGVNALQALETLTPDFLAASKGGGAGIVIQGVAAAGGDVHNFAGTDLVLAVTQHLSPTGEYDDTTFGPFAHAEAMMGLLAAGADVDDAAVEWLLNAQTDGDWGDPDSNGIALNVLGQLGIELPQAVENLHLMQTADGGWGYGAASPNSTSEVVQGLVQHGENPFAPAWSQIVSGTVMNPADAVIALQGDNGCWPNLYGPGDDPFATTDAVLLLVPAPGAENMQSIADGGTAEEPVMAEPVMAEPAESEPTQTPEPTATVTPTAEPPAPTETPAPAPTALPTNIPAASGEATQSTPTGSSAGADNLVPGLLIGAVVLLVIGMIYLSRREASR
ncbi:MAG: hypothetical protein ACE5E7_03655 [Anaerolineae bacterium]